MPAVFGVKLPSDIDTVRAGFMNMCTVALRTVHEAPIRVGEVVALSGLGIIGSLTAHLVRKRAGTLILIDPRSEARRVGKECVRTCIFRWSPYHSQQQTK